MQPAASTSPQAQLPDGLWLWKEEASAYSDTSRQETANTACEIYVVTAYPFLRILFELPQEYLGLIMDLFMSTTLIARFFWWGRISTQTWFLVIAVNSRDCCLGYMILEKDKMMCLGLEITRGPYPTGFGRGGLHVAKVGKSTVTWGPALAVCGLQPPSGSSSGRTSGTVFGNASCSWCLMVDG